MKNIKKWYLSKSLWRIKDRLKKVAQENFTEKGEKRRNKNLYEKQKQKVVEYRRNYLTHNK